MNILKLKNLLKERHRQIALVVSIPCFIIIQAGLPACRTQSLSMQILQVVFGMATVWISSFFPDMLEKVYEKQLKTNSHRSLSHSGWPRWLFLSMAFVLRTKPWLCILSFGVYLGWTSHIARDIFKK